MIATSSQGSRDFTPAVPLLWAYDPLVALLTRERRWRSALLRQLNPIADDVIADIGCGTGSFLALVGTAAAPCRLIGIDPDEAILVRARTKLAAAGVNAECRRGYLRDASSMLADAGVTKIVSSLVFHQVPLAEKQSGLAAMYAALKHDGELHVADYGLQRTFLMRSFFRTVQIVDGFEDTQPNAEGALPRLMMQAGFADVDETEVIPTATGSISLYRAVKRTRAGIGT